MQQLTRNIKILGPITQNKIKQQARIWSLTTSSLGLFSKENIRKYIDK